MTPLLLLVAVPRQIGAGDVVALQRRGSGREREGVSLAGDLSVSVSVPRAPPGCRARAGLAPWAGLSGLERQPLGTLGLPGGEHLHKAGDPLRSTADPAWVTPEGGEPLTLSGDCRVGELRFTTQPFWSLAGEPLTPGGDSLNGKFLFSAGLLTLDGKALIIGGEPSMFGADSLNGEFLFSGGLLTLAGEAFTLNGVALPPRREFLLLGGESVGPGGKAFTPRSEPLVTRREHFEPKEKGPGREPLDMGGESLTPGGEALSPNGESLTPGGEALTPSGDPRRAGGEPLSDSGCRHVGTDPVDLARSRGAEMERDDSEVRPYSHRTRHATPMQMGTFLLWCYLQAVCTLPLTTTGPICLRCIACHVPHPV